MTDLASAPGGDFNLVPYRSKPFPQSQPPRLAALAAMFGLASQCSMLELELRLIIPLAMRFAN